MWHVRTKLQRAERVCIGTQTEESNEAAQLQVQKKLLRAEVASLKRQVANLAATLKAQ